MRLLNRSIVVRQALGVLVLAAVFLGPNVVGRMTSGGKLAECLENAQGPTEVVVDLGFNAGPSQQAVLQRYGSYVGGGDSLSQLVLANVPPRNLKLMSEIYWVESIVPREGCE